MSAPRKMAPAGTSGNGVAFISSEVAVTYTTPVFLAGEQS
jgi:hypothetical protein